MSHEISVEIGSVDGILCASYFQSDTPMMQPYWRLVLLACFSCLYLCTSFAALPELGSPSRSHLSAQAEKKMGQRVLIEASRDAQLFTDPILLDFLHQLLNRLLRANHIPENRFHIFLFQNSAINAFAGPNGILGMNTGTILAAHSAGEIASVLAHEIAHVEQHHIARGVTEQDQLIFPTLGLLAAGLAVGGQAGQGIATAGVAGITQHAINFTRENEQEADRLGMTLLYNAGFSPMDMPHFFRRLQTEARFNPIPPAFLLTHPLTEDRIADSLNRASAYKHIETTAWPYFDFIQMRLRAETIDDPYELIHNTTANKTAVNEYGLALALLRVAKQTQAQSVLSSLLKRLPDNPLVIYTKAQLDLKTQQDALTLLKQHQTLFTTHPALQYLYAEALEADTQYKEASQQLKQVLKAYPGNPEIYLSLATVLGKNKQLAQAYYYRAKALLLMGDPKGADELLDRALAQHRLPSTTRSDIYFLRDHIKKVKST